METVYRQSAAAYSFAPILLSNIKIILRLGEKFKARMKG
jgi:hypothetical protein